MKRIVLILGFLITAWAGYAQQQYSFQGNATGTDTYTTSITNMSAYSGGSRGVVIHVFFDNANTGAATLQVNSLAAIDIAGTSSAGTIADNSIKTLAYNVVTGDFDIVGGGSGGGGSVDISDVTGLGTNVETALGVAAGAAGGFWRDTDFMQSRTITGADDLDQTDNLRTVYANGSSDFDIDVDLLTAGSRVLVINVGTDTVTLVDGSGAAIVGGPVDIAPGQNAIIDYRIAATPEVYTGSSSLDVGSTAISGGTSGRILYNNAGVLGEYPIGTGVATWIATPSYTNFLAAITGTSPYYTTGAGGTSTASNTFTHNFENGLNYSHTFTATGNNSYATTEGGTLTARATASDNLIFKRLNPTLVASAATQSLIALDLQPTFTPGAFSPRQFSIRAASGDLLFGTNTPFATVTNYQFQASSGSNNVLRVTNSSGATSQLFRADGTLSIGNNLASIALTDASGLTESVTGTTFRLSNSASRNNTNDVQYLFLQGNDASTAATTHNVFRLVPNASSAFAPTSGSTNFRAFYLNPSINQTGTASGTITLFDIEPTETGILGTYYSFLSRPINARSGFATGTPVSTLDVDGSFGMDVTSTSSDLTLTHIHHTVLVDASGANRTITLPAVAAAGRREYTVKKIDVSGNTVTIDGNSSETIDGATTYVLSAQWEYVTFQTEGTAWYVTGNN